MDKLIIGIPTINRADLLKHSLDSISNLMSDLFRLIIVDNGDQDIEIPENLQDKTDLVKPENNMGVAGSWNHMAKMAFDIYDSDSILILNDDIVLGKTTKELEKIESRHEGYYILVGTQHWSCFMLSREGYKTIGEFDEDFYPAYFEDNDYTYRIKLEDEDRLASDFNFDPRVFRNSMTIKKNPDLNSRFMDNKRLYMEKWGGVPGKEKYTTPYNR